MKIKYNTFSTLKSFILLTLLGGFVSLTFGACILRAQNLDNKNPLPKEVSENGAAKNSETENTIEKLTEGSDLIEGLFSFYLDRKTGGVRLLLSKDQLEKEYLHVAYVEDGLTEFDRLSRGHKVNSNAKLFTIRRFYNRIEFVEKNTDFYFNPEKAISRAANADVSHSVFFEETIEGEDEEKGLILIKADQLFLTEALNRITPRPSSNTGFSIGKINQAKTKIRRFKNYPENTVINVEYVFENATNNWGVVGVTDPRFVSIFIQHSLIKAPDEVMEPRFSDPRMGYMTHQVTDLSSLEVTPYRDVIKRWRLEKKNPNAVLSEPKKPIVFWIENTTPVGLRPIIKKAGLRWNEAFKKAGFKKVIQIEIQPDETDWDAGDIHHNVIRWAVSPSLKGTSFGSSIMDPRSGEILGADIFLEYSKIRQMSLYPNVFLEASTDQFLEQRDSANCVVSIDARNQSLFGMTTLEALGAETEEKQRYLEEFIYWLTLHEMGHTLGLGHNLRSSYFQSLDDIFDPEKTYPIGLSASVMDYPAIPFNLPGEKQGQFSQTRPGPFDHWVIEFGYSPALKDEDEERKRLESILARSTEPGLAFANNADGMSRPGAGIDPRVMAGDMTSDPIGFAKHQIALVKTIQPMLKERLLKKDESYQDLLNGYEFSIRHYGTAFKTVSRYIGGVYVDRSMVGQAGASEPLTPVSLADQKRAMETLRVSLFAPDAFEPFDEVANYLLAQRRGSDHWGETEDPKLHQLALGKQIAILDHLLHANVLTRITDSSLYGNEYTLDQFLTDLTDAIFEADLKEDVNTYRQNLQLEYVERLLNIVNGKNFDKVAQSMALNRLRWIENQMVGKGSANLQTTAHREHILYRIETGLSSKG